ncbi:MAG: sigma-70 family RNA polymerase sigma factor [Acidobacteriota bacterium]|nr:sigma-70 family RNA polymerase sigma factor [Acidobacteriota bacterium]
MINERDAAADVVQDVWLRAVRGMTQLREPSKFRPWLFGIARRVVMDRLRARYAEPLMEQLDLGEIDAPAADDEYDEDLAMLQAGLDRLPVLEREVLILFYLRELSLNDIAAIAAIPVGRVKSRLFRARRLLGSQLSDKGLSQ